MPDPAPLLKTRNLCRSFGGLQAVRHVSLDMEEGRVHALIGPNGAGKTTLVSLLSGRIPVSSGSVEFIGRDITPLPAYKRVRLGIAYTFQITSIYPQLSVTENLQIAGRYRSASGAFQTLDSILEVLGLGEFAGRRAGELAYGHQRLLEIGMGLALSPRLLILDEPTQGLSDYEIETFYQVIRAIRESTTVLLIEHNIQVVMALAERITVLDQGSVLADGTPEQIQADAAVQAAYLGA